jgi:prepilin-type N-terminal cleavage/methylation domain-containing protein
MNAATRGLNARGVTLVEVMVGLIILAVGLMSLISATFLSMRQTTRARDDVKYWADVQQVLDSLMAKGWNNVTAGSTTVRGRAITWTVSAAGSNPRQVTLIAQRYGYQQMHTLTPDTLVVYLSNPTVQ